MDDIEAAVKRELDKDVHISFKVTGIEIEACRTKEEMENMIDTYMEGVKIVMKSRIVMKNPRFK